MKNYFFKIVNNPFKIAFAVMSFSFRLNKMFSDELYLRCRYRAAFNKKLNLDSPKTFNEKLQWLKIYDHNPAYTNMVDKYEVRNYIAQTIGNRYLIPLLGKWNDINDINFDKLPNKFVLKCTHDSGGVVICTNKKELNIKKTKKFLEKKLNTNFFYRGREWPYKNVTPRVIAEQYMVDESGYELKDYKWFCFNGEPKIMFVATDRENNDVETKFDFFDMEFKHLPFLNGHPNSEKKIEKPSTFEEMKKLAADLSKNIPQVRIDFYDINGKVYFGEITFFHWSGMVPFEPEEWDYKLGNYIELPNNKY